MITLSEKVSLIVDLPRHDLHAGDLGVVIEVLESGRAFFVDFMTPAGETIDVVHVDASQIQRFSEPRPVATSRQ